MNHQVVIESKKPILDLRTASLDYFLSQGFKLTKDTSNFLQFERGNIFQNMITFNPLKWKSYQSTKLLCRWISNQRI